jgi:hypothetical protein
VAAGPDEVCEIVDAAHALQRAYASHQHRRGGLWRA